MNERVANQLSMRSKLLRDPRVSEFGFVSRVVGLTIETQELKRRLVLSVRSSVSQEHQLRRRWSALVVTMRS